MGFSYLVNVVAYNRCQPQYILVVAYRCLIQNVRRFFLQKSPDKTAHAVVRLTLYLG
jgi:hypothetical protein